MVSCINMILLAALLISLLLPISFQVTLGFTVLYYNFKETI